VGFALFTTVFCLTGALFPDLEASTVAASAAACYGLWKYVEQSPVDAQAPVLREARGRSGALGAGQGSPTVFSEFAAARPALPDLPFSSIGRGLHWHPASSASGAFQFLPARPRYDRPDFVVQPCLCRPACSTGLAFIQYRAGLWGRVGIMSALGC
jgi:hypothetical protein